MLSDFHQGSSSHGPDIAIFLYALVAALWAHALADPWGTAAVIVAIIGGSIRVVINMCELVAKKRRGWR